jgi:tetrahydromethanopterin S-methyltransferase subunit G
MTDHEFREEVLQRLTRIETKVDLKVTTLERHQRIASWIGGLVLTSMLTAFIAHVFMGG